jgi:hypothetical protein
MGVRGRVDAGHAHESLVRSLADLYLADLDDWVFYTCLPVRLTGDKKRGGAGENRDCDNGVTD